MKSSFFDKDFQNQINILEFPKHYLETLRDSMWPLKEK